jgi:ATP adenylyltransferase
MREAEWLDLAKHLSLCERILKNAYGAQGLNVGINLGRCAGAGVLGHLHVHVVPRWSGDTNFMSTTAGTDVLPEPLGNTYEKLKAALEQISYGARKDSRKGRRGSKKT